MENYMKRLVDKERIQNDKKENQDIQKQILKGRTL